MPVRHQCKQLTNPTLATHTNPLPTPTTLARFRRKYSTHTTHTGTPPSPPMPSLLARVAHHLSNWFKNSVLYKFVIFEIFTCILTKKSSSSSSLCYILFKIWDTYMDLIMNITVYNSACIWQALHIKLGELEKTKFRPN